MEETIAEPKTATKIKKYLTTTIEITPKNVPNHWWYNLPKEKQIDAEIKWYNDWVKEFEWFLRDHRSQDVQYVEAIRKEIDVCSNCGEEWDIYYEETEKKTLCANCGAEVK
jgi:hypothetical protein